MTLGKAITVQVLHHLTPLYITYNFTITYSIIPHTGKCQKALKKVCKHTLQKQSDFLDDLIATTEAKCDSKTSVSYQRLKCAEAI